MPTTLSDAAVASLQGYISQIQSDMASALALLSPSGTVWSRTGVANNPTFSNNDLTVAATSSHLVRASASFPPSNRYGEIVVDAAGSSGYFGVGIIGDTQSIASPPTSLAAVPAKLWCWRSDGYIAHNGTNSLSAPAFATSDNLGLYLNSFGEIYAQKNGTWIGDPVNRTGALFTGVTGDNFTMALVFFGANGSPVATGQFAAPLHTPVGASLYQ